MKAYWVYILECSNGSFYTGVTNDYERRLYEHQFEGDVSCYTYKLRPVKLVYLEEFNSIIDAIGWEKQVKGWSRKKKIAIIKNNWDDLPQLAKCKNKTHYSNK
tara:strand:- start:128 stop:436 length:309 start_codon:yes stop_codon:yes gene_type:complete